MDFLVYYKKSMSYGSNFFVYEKVQADGSKTQKTIIGATCSLGTLEYRVFQG